MYLIFSNSHNDDRKHQNLFFSRSLLTIFWEAKYWEILQFEIPAHVQATYAKSDLIQLVYESVLSVVMNYNKILASLSDQERLLFKPLITNVERKIAPGLSKLTWAAEVSDAYIMECSASTSEVKH